jgi:2-polyprenyl-6-methoxyphenol hydroxylase-like FAD-dependent oxidoreductase
LNSRNSLRIAIVGGGPAGLTLARILWTRGVAATVFEQEKSDTERGQGGSLDLHPESGQHALRLAGLEAEFRALARFEDQGVRLLDKGGAVLFEDQPGPGEGDRPEVDRAALRRTLLDSLPGGTVCWGHKTRTVEPREDGTYELTFTNGRVERFDLVVGADGAWSRVRPLLSTATPDYTGVTFVDLGIDDVDARHPEIARLVGHGKIFALGDRKGLIAQRNGHGHVRVYVGLTVPMNWATEGGVDFKNPGRAREGLADLFADWSPELLALIRESGDSIMALPLYVLPTGHRWENRRGLTLLGDAAHLMSPFAGEGVNLAMLDAAELALALTERPDWAAAVREHEAIMSARAEEAAQASAYGLTAAFASDAPRSMLELFRSVMGDKPV